MASEITFANITTFALIAALTCSAATQERAGAEPSDSGYFLSWKQKGQLIGKGQIQDEAGVWYDIWIVPGYVAPARDMGIYLRQTGSNFAEYVQKEKYHDLAHHSGDAFDWAYNYCLTDLTVKGVPRAWHRYWSSAGQRTSRRVFGWWFAYPWAFLQGTVDTAVRVPLGLAGTALGTTWGSAVVPAYYAVDSAVAGTWHLTVEAVALPVAGSAWNTVIAPPMALAGQKPSPSRVDGFWVKNLGAQEALAAKKPAIAITPKDIEVLAQWGRALLTATQPSENKRAAIKLQIEAERERLNMLEKSWAAVWDEERKTVQSIGSDPALAEAIRFLRERDFDSRKTAQASIDVRRHLESLRTLSPAEVERIMDLLMSYPLAVVPDLPLPPPKTDPVKESIQVIKDIQ